MNDDTAHDKDVLDPNYPLMIKLKEKCPGTYAHAKNVADILETVATELGLDNRKLKIAGYYHDIGKIYFPLSFSENQPYETNMHDSLEPIISYYLITSHVANTVQILYDDPYIDKEIVDWCSQHHGTTLVSYFFKKSKTDNESDFRYKTKTPQSLEACLLMLCDHLEARMRSERKSGRIKEKEQVDTLVDSVFNELTEDDQFDDVILPKFKILRQIRKLLKRELTAKFEDHKRIDYKSETEKNNAN